MINKRTSTFVSTYELYENDPIQQLQLQHRLELVDAFQIQKGMRVLEIGCGQGDTTVALADAVGENGQVVGVDIASRDYGAPLTLGQATDKILRSRLGDRIDFYFETNLESFEVDGEFDIAILSHSSWYFRQPKELARTFSKLKHIAKRIGFAEWDLEFTDISQRSHFCAASIQALYSSFVQHDGNIQNLFHKKQIENMLEKAGFNNVTQRTVDATYLQDGQWEKDFANSIRSEFDQSPANIQTLVNSYYDIMNAEICEEQSLNSFVLCAER